MSIDECIEYIKKDESLSELQKNYMLEKLYEESKVNACLEMWD